MSKFKMIILLLFSPLVVMFIINTGYLYRAIQLFNQNILTSYPLIQFILVLIVSGVGILMFLWFLILIVRSKCLLANVADTELYFVYLSVLMSLSSFVVDSNIYSVVCCIIMNIVNFMLVLYFSSTVVTFKHFYLSKWKFIRTKKTRKFSSMPFFCVIDNFNVEFDHLGFSFYDDYLFYSSLGTYAITLNKPPYEFSRDEFIIIKMMKGIRD